VGVAMEERKGSCCCFCVGQRVLSLTSNSNERGTVKYVGAVEGYEGVWVGVEWDSGQGRHNGRVNGIQYFCTQDQLPSGSLVRPNKLSAGVSLLDALSSRYKATLSQSEEDDMYVTTQRRMRVAVELVGKNQVAEHQAHLEMLTVATLAYTGVCSAGAQGEIRSSAPSKKKNPISLSPPSSSSHISLTPPSSSSLFYCCCANERFDLFSLTKTKLVLGIFVMMVSMVCCLRKMHKMLICFLFLSVENFLGAIG
jgi:hypothetical protein